MVEDIIHPGFQLKKYMKDNNLEFDNVCDKLKTRSTELNSFLEGHILLISIKSIELLIDLLGVDEDDFIKRYNICLKNSNSNMVLSDYNGRKFWLINRRRGDRE